MIENNFAEVSLEDRDLILWRNAARLYKTGDLSCGFRGDGTLSEAA
jgi:hypothetical protein